MNTPNNATFFSYNGKAYVAVDKKVLEITVTNIYDVDEFLSKMKQHEPKGEQ